MRATQRLPWLAAILLTAAALGIGPATAANSPRAGGLSVAVSLHQILDQMTLAQRVGQLFMVGGSTTSVSPATASAIATYHVGSVILDGNSSAGASTTRVVSDRLQSLATPAATDGIGLFVATDQEGGMVQRLSGPGFSTIPAALTQGTWSPTHLEAQAKSWGSQLRTAGVNLNLAPVLGTVPKGFSNPPIGALDREYGHTPSVVAAAGTAFERGMLAAGEATTLKHFPGLGRVSANTDTSAGVTDHVTTYDDPYLQPFRAGVAAGSPFVMMTTADYALIDPGVPAAFSAKIIGGMLRGEMGFGGVVISDSLDAVQVQAWSPATRALDFIGAGGDLALVTSASAIPAMVAAVYDKAATDPAFHTVVDDAALHVLAAKARYGLLAAVSVTPPPTTTPEPPPAATTTPPPTTTPEPPPATAPTTAPLSTAPASARRTTTPRPPQPAATTAPRESRKTHPTSVRAAPPAATPTTSGPSAPPRNAQQAGSADAPVQGRVAATSGSGIPWWTWAIVAMVVIAFGAAAAMLIRRRPVGR